MAHFEMSETISKEVQADDHSALSAGKFFDTMDSIEKFSHNSEKSCALLMIQSEIGGLGSAMGD
jgi:hypothetical protein